MHLRPHLNAVIASRDLLVLLDHQEMMASQEKMDMTVRTEMKDVMAKCSRAQSHMSLVSSAHLDLQEIRDHQVRRDLGDQRDSQANLERTETKALPDFKDLSAYRDHKDLLVLLAQRDNPDVSFRSTVQLDPKDLLAHQDLQAKREFLERTEQMLVELLDRRATTEIQDHRDSLGPKDLRDLKDHLENLGLASTALHHALHLATNWLLAAVRTTNEKF